MKQLEKKDLVEGKKLEKPKDKVLEKEGIDLNIGKIIRVKSSEGAIFELGDKITVFTKDSPNKGKVFTIKGFRWNNAKTNICAITELHSKYGIGLDKIELYSEPIVKELSLLEQAKLKYPIGTKFKVACQPHVICTVLNHDTYYFQTEEICNLYVEEQNYGVNGATVYYKGKWAEIVDDFKLPENWCVKRTIDNYKIINNWCNNNKLDNEKFNYRDNSGYIHSNTVDDGRCFKRSINGKQHIAFTEIKFEQFEQYVLHNGFKVGDRFNKSKSLLNHTEPYAVNEREIIDLQYINGQSVAFYKIIEIGYSGPQCRILTKNIVK